MAAESRGAFAVSVADEEAKWEDHEALGDNQGEGGNVLMYW
jgi:hypothetical protein